MPAFLKFLKREALFLGVCVLVSVLLVFPLSYAVGTRTFGPYEGGDGLLSYVGDLFASLASGNAAIWFFLLSPWLVLQTLRIAFTGWFRMKHPS